MRILVCDDREANCNNLVATIRGAIGQETDVEGWAGAELGKKLVTLFKDIEGFLDDSSQSSPDESPFDNYDLIVLDNNLTHLELPGARLSAESIAGYIRAFTAGRYIISVNKNPNVDFDLRFLIGDYTTRTDLALNETHLGNRALWTGNPSDTNDGFIPWYWPRLNGVIERRQEQIALVRERLDEPVFSSLAFSDDAIGFLSNHAKGALSPGTRLDGGDDLPINEVTFIDVFCMTDLLPLPHDRQQLHEARENPAVKGMIARVVAAHIDHWFRRDVLGPQEALVDLPHLLMRLPFLLGERAGDPDQWNEAIVKERPPYNLDAELYKNYLSCAEFEHQMWNSGPCFWWPKLKHNEALNKYFMCEAEEAWADVVFCEDSSLFVDRRSQDQKEVVEFSAEFEGNWKSRYLRRIFGKQYSPRTRLTL